MDEVHQKLFAMQQTEEIQQIFEILQSETGFKLAAHDRQPFLYFHDFITNPRPQFISDWRSDPKQEMWYHRLVNGILGDVQNAFACVLYHAQNLERLESSVLERVEKIGYRKIIGNSSIGGGNTLRLDFEYQAFVLAYRRCLDYLTRSVAAYFKHEFHSFRTIDKPLGRIEDSHVPKVLIPIVAEFRERFAFVLSDGGDKSIRDRVSHYEFVPAGVFNLTKRGMFMAGGGEELNPVGEFLTLSETIDGRAADLRKFLRKSITGFVDGMRQDVQTNL